jgi:hypothetical protein
MDHTIRRSAVRAARWMLLVAVMVGWDHRRSMIADPGSPGPRIA